MITVHTWRGVTPPACAGGCAKPKAVSLNDRGRSHDILRLLAASRMLRHLSCDNRTTHPFETHGHTNMGVSSCTRQCAAVQAACRTVTGMPHDATKRGRAHLQVNVAPLGKRISQLEVVFDGVPPPGAVPAPC